MKSIRFIDKKGQSIIELALMTPLILVALYIPADFGIGLFTAHLAQNAVREAARIGSTQKPFSQSGVETEATNRLPSTLKSPTVTAALHDSGPPACAQWVRVSVTGNYNYFLYQILRFFGFSTPNNVSITRVADMRYVYQPATNNSPCT